MPTSEEKLITLSNLEQFKQDLDPYLVHNLFTLTTVAGNGNSGNYLSVRWYISGVDGITQPYDGMKIAIKIPVVGVSTAGAMLSINGNTDADYHPLAYNNNTVLTSHFPVNSVKIFTYVANQSMTCYKTKNTSSSVAGIWKAEGDYDSNTTITYGTIAYYFRPYAAESIYRYKLVMLDKDNRLVPLVTNEFPVQILVNNVATHTTIYSDWASSTNYAKDVVVHRVVSGASKWYKSLQASNKNHAPESNATWWTEIVQNSTPTTHAFRPDKIYWYNTTATIASGAAVGGNTLMSNGYNQPNLAYYNFNEGLLTYKIFYLCGTYDKNTGLFTLRDAGVAGSKNYYTILPTDSSNITLSNYFTNGYDYILVGGTYSSNNYIHLREDHPMYHFDGTNLVPYNTWDSNITINPVINGYDANADEYVYTGIKKSNDGYLDLNKKIRINNVDDDALYFNSTLNKYAFRTNLFLSYESLTFSSTELETIAGIKTTSDITFRQSKSYMEGLNTYLQEYIGFDSDKELIITFKSFDSNGIDLYYIDSIKDRDEYIEIDFETNDLTNVTEGNDIYYGTYALSQSEYEGILAKKNIRGRIGNNRVFSWPMNFKLETYDEYIDSESYTTDENNNAIYTHWVKSYFYIAQGASKNIFGVFNTNYEAKIEINLIYSGSWDSLDTANQQAPDFSYGNGKSITPTISYKYGIDYLATGQFFIDTTDSSINYYFDQLLLQAYTDGRSEAKMQTSFDGFITELNLIVQNSSAFSSFYPFCQLKFKPAALGVNNAYPTYYTSFMLSDSIIDENLTTNSTYDIYIQSWGYSNGNIAYQKMIILKRLDSKEINDTYVKKMVISTTDSARSFISNNGSNASMQTTYISDSVNNDFKNYILSTNLAGIKLGAYTIEGGSITNSNEVILTENNFTWNNKTIATENDLPKITRYI